MSPQPSLVKTRAHVCDNAYRKPSPGYQLHLPSPWTVKGWITPLETEDPHYFPLPARIDGSRDCLCSCLISWSIAARGLPELYISNKLVRQNLYTDVILIGGFGQIPLPTSRWFGLYIHKYKPNSKPKQPQTIIEPGYTDWRNDRCGLDDKDARPRPAIFSLTLRRFISLSPFSSILKPQDQPQRTTKALHSRNRFKKADPEHVSPPTVNTDWACSPPVTENCRHRNLLTFRHDVGTTGVAVVSILSRRQYSHAEGDVT
ncbi:hypothetical protein RRG08_013587 [Elysia crispata]|uniref:Uncharacterized protein n=1 Tax=Elysia crispata TaxID=231223 RepID=A0AAE0Y2L5_9GAST|nr:hypothetical protein RRG08_013587 [Elysia crispata]